MSYNVLSARRTRYYARLLGIPFDRIITRGGSSHTFDFRTIYHQHGHFYRYYCGERWWVNWHGYPGPGNAYSGCWTTCKERFPEDFEGYPPYRYIGPRGSDWIENGV